MCHAIKCRKFVVSQQEVSMTEISRDEALYNIDWNARRKFRHFLCGRSLTANEQSWTAS